MNFSESTPLVDETESIKPHNSATFANLTPSTPVKGKRNFPLLPILITMGIVIIGIFTLPIIGLHSEYQWLNELTTVTFSDVLELSGDFSGQVFDGVLITMTFAPLFAAIISFLGGLFKSRMLCMISSATASCILLYFLYCFADEFGVEIIIGEHAILSAAFWIALLGHIAAFLFCKFSD